MTRPAATGDRRAGSSCIIVKRGQSVTDALAARTPKDYAIEFGEYLAKSAERYMAAVNSLESARGDDCDQTPEDAERECSEAYQRLCSDIYDFRKRAARAYPVTSQKAPTP